MSVPDPFLFCVFHLDRYPAGHADHMFAPRRGNGSDFDWSQPYRLYHGSRVPGFPRHPHRGFETLTIVLRGLVDHADSLGSSGRYGEGDMQWLTAAAGVQHQEMFPLVRTDAPNTLHLYQLWLNLPAASKLSPPGYAMQWAETVKRVDGEGGAHALVYAGALGGATGCPPPPHSWAAEPGADVGAFVVRLPPGSAFTLPPAAGGDGTARVALVTLGAGVEVEGEATPRRARVALRGGAPARLHNAAAEDAEVLCLQGRPIGEPVAQRGPFVMNTAAELRRAMMDYQATEFGGWPLCVGP
jgi:redox-sensitive bicupin YhaK (pirin superfamily)